MVTSTAMRELRSAVMISVEAAAGFTLEGL
jgi:hypothetical protein